MKDCLTKAVFFFVIESGKDHLLNVFQWLNLLPREIENSFQ